MDRKSFEYKMRDFRFCDFGRFMFFKKGMELYDTDTGEAVRFDSYKELFAYELPTGETMGDLVDELESILKPMEGGRGSGSTSGTSKFRFGSAGGNGAPGKPDFPARFNTGDREQSLHKQIEAFMGKHGGDNYESLISVSPEGYVTTYTHGQAHSVELTYKPGDHVIHNHPGGGHFSDADLINMANTVSLPVRLTLLQNGCQRGKPHGTVSLPVRLTLLQNFLYRITEVVFVSLPVRLTLLQNTCFGLASAARFHYQSD